MKRGSIIGLLLLIGSLSVTAQYTKEFKRIFFDAEYLYVSGFYDEAFSRYKNLLTLDPGNANILFHCGTCCLYLPGKEAEAVTYLKEAAPGVKLDYQESSYRESGAPVIAYYTLGRAYHLTNQFDLAIEHYQMYLDAGAEEDPVQLSFARIQIDACERARKVVDEAPSFAFQSVLDQFEEELPSCSNPVISGGGDLLIFLVDYPNDKKIMESRKEGDYWSRPKVINSYLGMVGETVPVSLSYDGKELYLMHQFYSHSDIFVSRYENGRWTEAEALGHHVNGRTSETHASISKDGNTLYFVSDKRGGQGSMDLFVSRKNEKGEWGEPRNLGPVINTSFEERTPFISANDSILFFSSQGHHTIGGLDVFYSELGPDGQWGEPVNLGFPVNTTDDNIFFNPGWNEMDGYYAMRREDDPTSNTINMVINVEAQEMLAEETEVEEPVPDEEVQPPTATTTTVVALPLLVGDEGEEEEEVPLEQAIEPEETDDIHLALNNGNLDEDTGMIAADDADEAHLSVVPVQGSKVLVTSVPFDHNRHNLSLGAILEAERIADLMTRYPESRAKIIGHADETGAADYNLMISHQRAESVLGYLEIRGVDMDRITLEARGEHSPAALVREADGSRSQLGLYVNRQVRVCVQNPSPMRDSLAGFYVPSHLMRVELASKSEPAPTFTIQVKACMRELPQTLFGEIEGIREYVCDDGYYRYAVGEFPDLRAAKASLEELQAEGYPDAFIQTLIYYERATQQYSKPGP